MAAPMPPDLRCFTEATLVPECRQAEQDLLRSHRVRFQSDQIFTALRKLCLQPRCRSVVCTETFPNRN
jgi:hypothetical protein